MNHEFPLRFPGYKVDQQLGETHYSCIYKARKTDTDESVIIKAIRLKDPSPSELAQIKHDCERFRELSIPGILPPLDFFISDGNPVLVRKDFGGISLEEMMAKGISLDRFLGLAISIAEILGELHQQNMVHRSIKPHNILVNPDTGDLKITDIGFEAVITQNYDAIGHPDMIHRILPYISPEQTGRLNGMVDARTDLYSLGVTFYEMATGSVPFPFGNPMEIIHGHIAKAPAPPHTLSPDIPEPVSDIIVKLLSKAPSDRYQSCEGLCADLKEAFRQLNQSGSIASFPLGSHDVSFQFHPPETLVSRENQLDQLNKAFENACGGISNMVHVVGEPGVGKSALVQEFHKSILTRPCYFISGKCDQYQRTRPYNALVQAFRSLVRQLLSESNGRLDFWKNNIQTVLGQNGKIITDMVPELEQLIGKQPDIPDVMPEETRNRFTLAVRQFIGMFANKNHPLILFLDDIQWIDFSTYNLIMTLMTEKSFSHMLFVSAYRDNEVTGHHPILMSNEDIAKKGLPLRTIRLEPLDTRDISQMLRPFLHQDQDTVSVPVMMIHTKTKGNPFFIHQFLKTLHRKHYLYWDGEKGWIWDPEGIRSLEATENVVRFMAENLGTLPELTRSTLSYCACMGNSFDPDILSAVSGRSMDEIISVFNDLAQEGLIAKNNETYFFYHDRIQEAAYGLLSESQRKTIHYQIGKRLVERTPADLLPSKIFTICDQLNNAGNELIRPEERIRLAELNLTAGIRAKDALAYQAAVTYLDAGRHLLSADAWETHYRMTFTLFTELMSSLFLNHEFDKAENLYDLIMTHARTRVDKGEATCTMIDLYTLKRPAHDAIQLGLRTLEMFDLHIPENVSSLAIFKEIITSKYLLKKVGVENIVNLPDLQDEELIVIQRILLRIAAPAFYVNPKLMAFLTLTALNFCLRHGLFYISSITLILAANIIRNVLGNDDLAYRLSEIALTINERFDNKQTEVVVLHTFAHFHLVFRNNVRAELDVYPKVYEMAMNVGSFIFAGYSISAEVDCRRRLGQPLQDVLDWLESHRDFIFRVNDPNMFYLYYIHKNWMETLMGRNPMERELSSDEFDFDEQVNQAVKDKENFKVFISLYFRLQLYVCQKKWAKAREIAVRIERYARVPLGSYHVVNYHFIAALTFISHARHHGWGTGDKKRVKTYMMKLSRWSRQCPENFKHKADFLAAEIERMKGRVNKAIRLYHEAIDNAREHSIVFDQALASETLGEYYLSLELNEEALEFLKRAYNTYTEWGAHAPAQKLIETHPEISPLLGRLSHDSAGGTTSSETLASSLDLSTVITVSQMISSEIMLDRLLKKTMHMCVTNAGAERGFLIFEENNTLLVQACEDVLSGEQKVLQAQPLETEQGLSPAIVNYVHHSGENLILGHASGEGPFVNDPHIRSHQCQSVLCIPIINKGTLACILYMENNLSPNVFTAERLEILKVITAQAAISLQNARLYDEIASEIHVRKRAEEAMGISEGKYRSILEEMLDAYCETDLRGAISFINPSACMVTGYTPEELIGCPIQTLVHIPEVKTMESYYGDIYNTGEPGKPMACNLVGKKGNLVPLEIVTSLIRDKEGNIIGFRNVGRDVSERMRLENDLMESSKNVQAARAATILGLAKLAEFRDEDTGTHLERIREYARLLAGELARKPEYQSYITEEYIEDIYNSSILHDIGKVGVPDAILLKPGKLTKEEFDIIKTHTTLGGDALKAVETKIQGQTFLTLGKEIAYFHHEKWDGTGYPKGLAGKNIPLSARIVAIADVYDALTSKRVYKEAFPHQKAVDIIVKDRGTHFDPDVVDAFIKHQDDFRRIREELFDEGCQERKAV